MWEARPVDGCRTGSQCGTGSAGIAWAMGIWAEQRMQSAARQTSSSTASSWGATGARGTDLLHTCLLGHLIWGRAASRADWLPSPPSTFAGIPLSWHGMEGKPSLSRRCCSSDSRLPLPVQRGHAMLQPPRRRRSPPSGAKTAAPASPLIIHHRRRPHHRLTSPGSLSAASLANL